MLDRPAGDSAEQREAETAIMQAVGRELGVPLVPAKIRLKGGGELSVDGVSEHPPILCEAWAHLGPPKSGQRQKVMMDAFKLAFIARHSEDHRDARLLLAFADEAAARPFRGRSWTAHALTAFGITIHVADLSPALRAKVAAAQKRQRR